MSTQRRSSQIPHGRRRPSQMPNENQQEFLMEYNLTEEQIQTIKLSFQEIDRNGDGTLSKFEVKRAAQMLGMNPTDEDIYVMFDSANLQNSNAISYEEYVKIMIDNYHEIELETARMKAAFSVIDKDKSGFISVDELAKVLVYKNSAITEREIQEIFTSIDKDKNGLIDYNEFIDSDLCKTVF